MLVNSPSDFDYLEIGLASPERVRFWSYGEIEKPETINYRTFKPERKGLFCEKIFGPVKDWECSCGKYRRVRYRGIVCERCGVEVTHSKVRRERMGHIELAADVAHIWFLKGIPSYMGLLLDMTARQLEEVIYYDSYIVTEVSDSVAEHLSVRQLVGTAEYYDLKEKYGNGFKAEMGASAIKNLLSSLDLKKMVDQLREEVEVAKGQKKLKVTKRLRIVEALTKSGNRPEWMILDAIPVMPPDLRPMVQLEGGRFATSDLNDLYRRVVNRNNRLKRLMDIGAPEMIVRNEKRMLQEAVDVLISNGKRGRSVTGSNGRPLKSLGNIIEGKQGRFRQNLLGKRVDYSGRSVIVVGPNLKFHQCGLPKEMALELFKPFVIRKLVEGGFVSNVKSAKRKIESRSVVVWDVLEEVIQGQPVLLNRAPTLHRLGIQAFEPILVEGSAIQIHPLVCTAFNADFDGDQMAVHVPLSLEAQAECKLLIMSVNNILSPSNGQSIVTPSQDMVLGCYFLTVENESEALGKGKYFRDINEAWRAWESKNIGLQAEILLRHNNERIKTTMGRIIMNRAIWDTLDKLNRPHEPFINYVVGKKELSDLVYRWYIEYGNFDASELIDKLKHIGFKYATLSGISISVDDLRIPSRKSKILGDAEQEIDRLDGLEKVGSITSREKVLRSIDIWRGATSEIAEEMGREFGQLNNVFIMANSGARGNMDQVRQLAGMRGLMSDSQGRILVIPIKSNFKEGLSITEYFNACYGARKGLVDTALRTADSGYLTRRLVDVAQDVMVTIEDCGVKEGIELQAVREGLDVIVALSDHISGRVALKRVVNPKTKKVIVASGDVITSEKAKMIQDAGIDGVEVRHVYKCQAKRGICQACYGIDLGTSKMISVGEAVGIIAAQSIGEPGTQLTMRTFHTGGVDLRKSSRTEIKAKHSGKIKFGPHLHPNKILDEEGNKLLVNAREGNIFIVLDDDQERVYPIPRGSQIMVKDGAKVEEGGLLAANETAFEFAVCERPGIAKFIGISPQVRKDKAGKIIETFAKEEGEIFIYTPEKEENIEVEKSVADGFQVGDRIKSEAVLGDGVSIDAGGLITKIEKGKSAKMVKMHLAVGESYPVLSGAKLFVKDGQSVKANEIITRERISESDASKTKDIVQGLPRVEELFEARKPKESAVLSEIDGVVEISEKEGIKLLRVTAADGGKKDNKIPFGIRLKVYSGKPLKKGDQMTEGVLNPHDIMATKGVSATQTYLGEEIQKVYRSQGVKINGKHVEIIVRQMTRKVNIVGMGDSTFLPNELVDIRNFDQVNEKLAAEKKEIATGERVLLGITRASLSTESFISASSFQETARVLADAAIKGKTDEMYGLKENVIIGKLIPAGTGLSVYNQVSLTSLTGEELTMPEDQVFTQEQAVPATT